MRSLIRRGKIDTKYQGRIFTIYEQEVHFPNGETKLYEYCQRPASVSILAFDDKHRLLLIREWRVGYDAPTWFLPGGRMDHPEESPQKAAIRELEEEAGFKPRTIKLVQKKSPSSTLKWDIYLFAAKDLVPSKAEGDEEFPIEVVPTSLAKAVRMAKDGTIENEFIAYNIIRFNELLKSGDFVW